VSRFACRCERVQSQQVYFPPRCGKLRANLRLLRRGPHAASVAKDRSNATLQADSRSLPGEFIDDGVAPRRVFFRLCCEENSTPRQLGAVVYERRQPVSVNMVTGLRARSRA
jgi:hypothetical protein